MKLFKTKNEHNGVESFSTICATTFSEAETPFIWDGEVNKERPCNWHSHRICSLYWPSELCISAFYLDWNSSISGCFSQHAQHFVRWQIYIFRCKQRLHYSRILHFSSILKSVSVFHHRRSHGISLVQALRMPTFHVIHLSFTLLQQESRLLGQMKSSILRS